MFNIAVLVSGSGSNLQSIMDAIDNGDINAKITLVASDNADAYGLKRAQKSGIKTVCIPRNLQKNLLNELSLASADLVVLAGYLAIVPESIVTEFAGRIINIHPSLLPKYGGKGYYGMNVHQAVINAGEEESGATVHFVDNGIDTGEIIIQQKVAVTKQDTPQLLSEKVLEIEHKILVQAVKQLSDERSK